MSEIGSPSTLGKYAKLAEDLGFSFISLGDSQALTREVYSCLSIMAHDTNHIELGPVVTNPITRHPVVTASAICTLNELSNGRAILGLAGGDSAVLTIGETPADLETLGDVTVGIKGLIRGETAEIEGNKVRLEWVSNNNQPREVPIMIAAAGSKTQRLAGKIADRVLIGSGLLPDVLNQQITHVHEGAREIDRDPEEIEIWAMGRTSVNESKEEALGPIKSSLAGAANHALRFTMEGKCVPEDYQEPFREMLRRYDSRSHDAPGLSPNATLLDKLGLTDYVTDRWGVVGAPEDIIWKLNRIGSVNGVHGVYLTTPTDQTQRTIKRLGEEVLPKLS